MESSGRPPTPAEAAAALADAHSAQQRLATSVELPRGFSLALGAAIAFQIGTAAVGTAGIGHATPGDGNLALIAAGVVVFVAVAAIELRRFRQLNGVWLGGFASRVVFGTSVTASLAYMAGFGLAIWAAYEEAWALVAIAAIAGGAAYALSGRQWIERYHASPAASARGESALLLGALIALALAALVLLIIGAQ